MADSESAALPLGYTPMCLVILAHFDGKCNNEIKKICLVQTIFIIQSLPDSQNKDRYWYNAPMNQQPFFPVFHYVYILSCHDGTLYTGYTSNLIHRLQMHNRGKGAKYTKHRTPVYLTYHEVYLSKSDALKREYAIKQLSRAQKLELIQNHCFCLIDSSCQHRS